MSKQPITAYQSAGSTSAIYVYVIIPRSGSSAEGLRWTERGEKAVWVRGRTNGFPQKYLRLFLSTLSWCSPSFWSLGLVGELSTLRSFLDSNFGLPLHTSSAWSNRPPFGSVSATSVSCLRLSCWNSLLSFFETSGLMRISSGLYSSWAAIAKLFGLGLTTALALGGFATVLHSQSVELGADLYWLAGFAILATWALWRYTERQRSFIVVPVSEAQKAFAAPNFVWVCPVAPLAVAAAGVIMVSNVSTPSTLTTFTTSTRIITVPNAVS